MTRYFLYARKSAEDEGRQVLSIEAQLTELREFAARDSLTIVEEFCESRTAKVPGRPVFGVMMEKVQKSRHPIGLLSWHPDRLARNSVDGGLVIYLVDTGKIPALRFPTFWFEATPQGKFMLNIAFGQSKYYVDNLQENVKRGQRQKLRRGEYPSMAPIGYLNDPHLHTIVPDPKSASLILRMFEEYGENKLSVRQVHEQSVQWGLRSRSGKPFSLAMAWIILANPFYIGMIRWNGEYYEGSHPPIVPRELFDKVQERMRDKKKPRSRGKIPFPFTGLLRCRMCGCSITAEQRKGHTYYRCTKKKTPCTELYLREEMMVYCLEKIASQVMLPNSSAAPIFNQIELWRKKALLSYENLIPIFQDKLRERDLRLNRLISGYLDGTIEREEYLLQKERLIKEKLQIKEQMSRLKSDGDVWTEPMKRFFQQVFELPALIASKEPARLKNFLKDAGAALTMASRQVHCEWERPWKILSEFAKELRWLPMLLREVRADFEQKMMRKEGP